MIPDSGLLFWATLYVIMYLTSNSFGIQLVNIYYNVEILVITCFQ